MSKELDDAYFRSTPCTHHEPLLSKLVDCVNLLEERIKGLLVAKVYVGDTNTLPAGSEATAYASKRGYDTVLDFGIPKGDKGDPGAPGAPGSDANVTKENVEAALGYEPLNAEYANNIYIMQKQIENLQGIVATEETDSTEAYTKTVPTGAQKWASLDKVGGKTVVNAGELVSAEVVEVESMGKNLHDPSLLVFNRAIDSDNGIAYQTTSNKWYATEEYIDVRLLAGSNITFSGFLSTNSTTAAFYDINKTFISSASFNSENMTRTVPSNAAYMRYDCHKSNVDGGMLQLELGTIATAYSPYGVKGTFPIPAEVREMCPGYGWSAGTACNEIDFGRKVYVQRVDSVDLGTLEWVWNDTYKFFTVLIAGKNPGVSNMLTSFGTLDSTNIWQIQFTGDIYCGNQSNGGFYFKTSNTMTAQEFKQAMAGVQLYYELAKPVEVDLSDVLPDDNFIEVEAGGTVTFKQASTQLPVPSSVTYQISTSEVIANA